MAIHIAFLRAVNVGGTGKLPMTELLRICERAGFARARTWIQSGNAVFDTRVTPERAKAALEKELAKFMGKPVLAMVRSVAELESVIARNPFPKAEPNRLQILFFDEAVDAKAIARIVPPASEVLRASGRELFIHYPDGMGTSKLKVPGTAYGTARNLNTVRKMLQLAQEMAETG